MPIKKISLLAAGPWFDGKQGPNNVAKIVDLAHSYGFRVTRDDRVALRLFLAGDTAGTAKYNKGDVMTYDEAVTWVSGQHELCDRATEHLQDRTPRAYVIHWDADEVGMYHEAALPDYEGADRDDALREAFAWQEAIERLELGCQDGFRSLDPIRKALFRAHEIEDQADRVAAVMRIVKELRKNGAPLALRYGEATFELAALITPIKSLMA